eukprot:scaffold132490_cov55-Attheya_sp.AAC.2
MQMSWEVKNLWESSFSRELATLKSTESMPTFKKHESRGNLVEYAGVCILLNVDKNRIDKFLADYALDRQSDSLSTKCIADSK